MHVPLPSGNPISINQEFHKCKRPSRSALAFRQTANVQAHQPLRRQTIDVSSTISEVSFSWKFAAHNVLAISMQHANPRKINL